MIDTWLAIRSAPLLGIFDLENSALTPWILFIVAVVFFLALDLGVFHRHARVVKFKEAMTWTAIWFSMAMFFGFVGAPLMVPTWDRQDSLLFVTGYILELGLSMDNVFVIALIFIYFRVPVHLQHRVLFWGILGALIMRGVLIFAGVAMIDRFAWMLYVLGVFLILTGLKMAFTKDEEVHPEKNFAIRLARKFFPVSPDFDGQRFFTTFGGQPALTPLALVLLMVETTDLIFAVDSIPAIIGVTTNKYIVFTSNIFAILGLRSLYFALAGAIGYFRYLKVGLSLVLVFIGLKMLLDHTRFEVSIPVSLLTIGAIIIVSILASIVAVRRERRASKQAPTPPPGS